MSATATPSPEHWRARRAAAWTVAVLVRAGPVVAGLLTSLLVAMLLPAPAGTSAVVLWWTVVAVTPLVVVVAAEQAMRRLAPLTFLLRLSMAFPGEAPNRLKVLRETHRTAGLVDELRGSDPDQIEALPTAASTLALITALERHDRFTRGHSERVRLYADLLGEELGLTEPDRQRLRWAALLHDIGKLRVDGQVLNKAGRPDGEAWEQLQRHPDLGLRLAGPLVPWLGVWAGAISDHHERFDGTGYPAGKTGPDISLAGRIVSVADAYETMTAGRPYKRALSRQDARDELVACAGSQFDPHVVRTFLNLSLPRAPWPIALVAWLAELPLLARLKAAPNSAVHGAATAAGIATMAVSGLISPAASQPATGQQPAPAMAQPASPPHVAPEPSPQPQQSTQPRLDTPDRDGGDRADTGSPTAIADDPMATPPNRRSDEPASARQSPSEPPREVADDDSTLLTTLYLHATDTSSRRHDVLPMSGRAPDRRRLGNYDTDIDDRPGLRLRPTDRGRSETRLDRRQRWALTQTPPAILAGPLDLDIWVRAATTGTQTVQVSAFIDVCAPDLTACQPLTDGQATTTTASGGWQQVTVDIDPAGDLTLGQRVVVLTLTAGAASTSDVMAAFDTTDHPASLSAVRINLALSPPASTDDLSDRLTVPTGRER